VDTAAARVALAAGMPVHLVFPHGFRQEDGPITPARRRALRGAVVHELASPEFRDRTWTCVGLADAVILIDPAGGDGCQETIRAAERLGRPLLNLNASAGPARWVSCRAARTAVAPAVSDFLSRNRTHVLMIAGCRGSLLASQHKTAEVKAEAKVIAAVLRECQDRLTGGLA
jgi:Circularly permutated YpsA SLOG family